VSDARCQIQTDESLSFQLLIIHIQRLDTCLHQNTNNFPRSTRSRYDKDKFLNMHRYACAPGIPVGGSPNGNERSPAWTSQTGHCSTDTNDMNHESNGPVYIGSPLQRTNFCWGNVVSVESQHCSKNNPLYTKGGILFNQYDKSIASKVTLYLFSFTKGQNRYSTRSDLLHTRTSNTRIKKAKQ
jgi:hypothetical protein